MAMSLLPSLQVSAVADPAASITVVDTTGNYNAGTNPGGFGTPNTAKGAITAVILELESYSQPGTVYPIAIADPTNLFSTGQVLAAALFAAVNTAAGNYDDGVYNLNYYLGYTAGVTMTFAGGATSFLLTGADALFTDAVGFIIPAFSTSFVFLIDRTQSLSSAGGYTTVALPTITQPATIKILYKGSTQFLITKAGASCLQSDIALWSDTGCKGVDFRDIEKRYLQQLAMGVKFSKGLLYDAHNLAVALATYCSDNCNCATC